jgi:hypothetical protein
MSDLTGYLLSNGTDLSFVFQSGNCTTNSGFILSSGNDLSTIFSALTVNHGYKTGFIYSGMNDLSTLFNAKTPIPLNITGCSLWMDASDISKMTLTNSTSVNNWTDKSTNGYVFTSGVNKPTLVTNNQNGKSIISFNGSSNFFVGDTNSRNFTMGTNCYALFVVFKRNDTSNAGIYNKSMYGLATNRYYCFVDSTSKFNVGFVHNSGGVIGSISDSIIINNTSYQIVSMTVNRQTEKKDTLYVNGTSAASYSYPSGDTYDYPPSTYNMYIGSTGNSNGTSVQAGYYLNGNIAEIISYTNPYDMSNSTRQVIEGYLSWKWGIQNVLPISHQYYSSSP